MPVKRTFMRPTSIRRGSPLMGYYQDGRPTALLNMHGTDAWANYFRAPCESEFNRVNNLFTKDFSPGHLGPYGLIQTGSDDPLPVTRHDYEEIKTNNKLAWAAAKRPGSLLIVVSPFQRGYYTISQSKGSNDLTVDPHSDAYHTHTMPRCAGFLGATEGTPKGTFKFRGLNWTVDAPCQIRYRKVTGTFDAAPYQLGFPAELMHHWASGLPRKLTMDSEVITDALASANTGMVDLLTAVAETPDLFKSILAGCTTIFRMYKEARTGEIRFLNKAKKVRLELDRLKAKSKEDWVDVKAHEAHIQQIKNTERTLRELLDAVTSVWLNYRLNILPTVLTIEDTLKALDSLRIKFIRFRETKTSVYTPPSFEGWTVSGSVDIRERCFIKRGAREADMGDVLFSKNPFLTAWELVPLSFVVDRYMNIGALIASLAPRNSNVTEGATYSWKASGAVSWTHASGASVVCDINLYKRTVINPSSHVCLPFPSSRTVDQNLDHLALAWQLVLKKLK